MHMFVSTYSQQRQFQKHDDEELTYGKIHLVEKPGIEKKKKRQKKSEIDKIEKPEEEIKISIPKTNNDSTD